MKCPKCGATLADDVLFCRECGAKVKPASDSSAQNKTPSNGNTRELHSHINEENKDDSIKKQSSEETPKRRLVNMWNHLDIFCKFIAVGIVISVFMFLIALFLHKGFPSFISIIQIGGLIFAFLIHKDIIKIQKNWLKYIVLIVTIFIAILNVKSYSLGNKSVYDNLSNDTLKQESKITSIQLPVGKSECIGKKCFDIRNTLSESGFTNISFEKIEDLKASESEKVGLIESISINGNTEFKKNQTFKSNTKITINYHTYAKCKVNIHVNFASNLIFNKYDVEFNFDDINEGTLTHGKSEDYQFEVEPGEYPVEFISQESSSVKGETTLKVDGDVNVSYKIGCHNDKISVNVEYTENLADVGKNEIMMTTPMTDYQYKNYKDVKKALKKLGFTNIKTKILYDIELGLTTEGETEKVSINGNDNFKQGDIFSKNDEILITYHMKAEDNPEKKTEKKTDTKSSTESTENLTIDNCPELKAMLSNKAEIDSSYSDFATKYTGRIIEFDGRIDNCQHYKKYDTRFNYLVSAGDYDPDHQIGPVFQFENVNYYDLHTDMDTVSVGSNVHIVAEVKSFNSDNGLFYLKPVSVTKR